MRLLEEVKRWLGEIIEIALLLVAIGIICEILFGATVPFFSQIVPNLNGVISNFGENGLVGLIGMGIILWVFHRRRAPAPQN